MKFDYIGEDGDQYRLDINRRNGINHYSLRIHLANPENPKNPYENWLWTDNTIDRIMGTKFLKEEIKRYISKIIKLMVFV